MSKSGRTKGTSDAEAWVIEGLNGGKQRKPRGNRRAAGSASDWLSAAKPRSSRKLSTAEPSSEPDELREGKLEANTATFEQLRAAGLSLTQSANLIRQREAQGGFRSLADLGRIPGLSQAARRTIGERIRVGRRRPAPGARRSSSS